MGDNDCTDEDLNEINEVVLVGGSSRALPVRNAVRKALIAKGFLTFSSAPSISAASASSSPEGEHVQDSKKISNSNSNSDANSGTCGNTNTSADSSSRNSSGLLKSNKQILSGISFELKSSGSSNTVRNFSSFLLCYLTRCLQHFFLSHQ